ncbi:MAG: YerC/YecD family TrpR-related protein [Patescibacteria group bacterium]|jgi:TrpR-related protein YerC/YecD
MKQYKPDEKTDDLLETILSLKNLNEARAFFRDLCTLKEIKDLTDRWEIAKLIEQGAPYRDIAKKLGTSTTTVSRVALWFNNGMGGYRLMLDRLNLDKNNEHHASSSFGKGLRVYN